MDDPTRPSLNAIASAGHAFSVPWSHDVRLLMTTLDSSLLIKPEGPWMTACPFDVSGMKLTTILQDTAGTSANFRDGLSTNSGSETEHLSAALGITVGYPFLNASVTGQYDRDTLETRSGIRASRNASYRLGRIVLNQTPPLSAEALDLLRKRDGPVHFQNRYGDFYVCGYELGADAGATLFASTQSSSIKETLSLTVAVKVLFFEESVTHTTTSSSYTSNASMTFCGYSTLQKATQSTKTESLIPSEQARMQRAASAYLKRVGSVDHEAKETLAKLGLKDGQTLPLSSCTDICQSGLVVQLLLAPLARLNDFVASCKASGLENDS